MMHMCCLVGFQRSADVCGRRSVNFEPPRPSTNRLGRVVNGVDAPVGAYPWQVDDVNNPITLNEVILMANRFP